MNPTSVAVISLIVEIFILACGVVWGLGAIKSTTAVLNETIKSLKYTIDQLRVAISDIQEQQSEHKAKIAVLESKK